MAPAPMHSYASRSEFAQREVMIDQAASVSKQAFRISIGLFFALAMLSVIFRVVIRLRTRKRLYLDDCLVLLATLSLCASTSIVFKIYPKACLSEAADKGVVTMTPEERKIAVDIIRWVHVLVPLVWLVVYAIKFAFLFFFHNLIRQLSLRLVRYYWTVVGLVVTFWLVSSFQVVVTCNGTDMKCMVAHKTGDTGYARRQVGMNGACSAMDIVADILIISIPLLVLRKSLMRTAQKVSIAILLCLSGIMVVFAMIRIIRPLGKGSHSIIDNGNIPTVWLIFWLVMEACTAVIVASVIVIRSIFLKQPTNDMKVEKVRPMVLPSWWRSEKEIQYRLGSSGEGKEQGRAGHLSEANGPTKDTPGAGYHQILRHDVVGPIIR